MSYCDGDDPGEVRGADGRGFWFHALAALFILAVLILTARPAL